MPEIKHNFTAGKMNKDLDERLIPNGEYRDAMNIQVSTSESSDVGAVQNILGNSLVDGQHNISLNPGEPFMSGVWTPNAGNSFCVGSVSDEKDDALYWFIHGNESYGTTSQIYYTLTEALDASTSSNEQIRYIWRDFILKHSVNNGNNSVEFVFVDLYKISILGVPVDAASSIVEGIDLYDVTDIKIGDRIYLVNPTNGMYVTQPNGVPQITRIEYGSGNEGTIYLSKPMDLSQQGYFDIVSDRVLNFKKDNLITGINIIDDMLFWTDNYSEPKKINIPRSIEGTDIYGKRHTKLINHDQSIDLGSGIYALEKHITVLKNLLQILYP